MIFFILRVGPGRCEKLSDWSVHSSASEQGGKGGGAQLKQETGETVAFPTGLIEPLARRIDTNAVRAAVTRCLISALQSASWWQRGRAGERVHRCEEES